MNAKYGYVSRIGFSPVRLLAKRLELGAGLARVRSLRFVSNGLRGTVSLKPDWMNSSFDTRGGASPTSTVTRTIFMFRVDLSSPQVLTFAFRRTYSRGA